MLQLCLGQVGQPFGFDLEPLVNLGLRHDVLVYVPRLVAQIQHHAIRHRLVKFVGVDVAAKDFDALFLVGFQQRCAGEADEHRVRQNRLHRLMQITGLRPVAFIHEHIQIALGHEILGQGFFHFLDVALDVPHFLAVFPSAELVNQRAHQPRRRCVQAGNQIRAALGAVNVLFDAKENLFDLLIQFRPVGDDQHP